MTLFFDVMPIMVSRTHKIPLNLNKSLKPSKLDFRMTTALFNCWGGRCDNLYGTLSVTTTILGVLLQVNAFPGNPINKTVQYRHKWHRRSRGADSPLWTYRYFIILGHTGWYIASTRCLRRSGRFAGRVQIKWVWLTVLDWLHKNVLMICCPFSRFWILGYLEFIIIKLEI